MNFITSIYINNTVTSLLLAHAGRIFSIVGAMPCVARLEGKTINWQCYMRTVIMTCLLMIMILPIPSQAQGFRTSRDPLIPGAAYAPPFAPAMPGRLPPPGSGMTPTPVTPGMSGAPLPPPTIISIPPRNPLDRLPSVPTTPSLSTPGADPGILPGTTYGFQAPAAVVPVNPGIFRQPISGVAPITKWSGQTSRDFGYYRTGGAQTTDFGQNIDHISSTARSHSEDGPRPTTGGQNGATTRQPNLNRAQTTTDLYGNRTLFKGANLPAVMTLAPY